jgi:hypothetical protein
MEQTQKTNNGIELRVYNGVLNLFPVPMYDENRNILERNLLIWTEQDGESPCSLRKKDDVIALRDYLNLYLEEFYD